MAKPKNPVERPSDIVCDIVNRKKLKRVVKEIDALRSRGGVGAGEIWSVLVSVGRTQKGKVWRSEPFPHLRPITVHDHPVDLNRFTKNGILDDIESNDVAAWNSALPNEDDDGYSGDD